MAGGDGAFALPFCWFSDNPNFRHEDPFLLFVAQVPGVPARLPLGLAGTLRALRVRPSRSLRGLWPVQPAVQATLVDQQRPHGPNHPAL